MTPTLILFNGKIVTMEDDKPEVSAVAILNDKIIAVGSDAEVKSLGAAETTMVDLGGRLMTPGLVDAHVHFRSYALALQEIDVLDIPDKDEVLRRVKEKAEQTPKGEWLSGRGWKNELWEDRSFPTAAQLDAVAPDHPVFLRDKSGHMGWANTRALQAANITGSTVAPEGGSIELDGDGNPTGMFFETAMELIRSIIPEPTDEQTAAAMRTAQEACWRAGLTGLHDFDGPDCFRALQILNRNGDLGLRIYKNIPAAMIDNAVAVGLQTDHGNEWLRIGGIKIFADGALGPKTALMIEPYEGTTDEYGMTVVDKEGMYEIASKASANNLSVTVHAIGDKANHDILDVYEAVRKEEAARPPRPEGKLRHRIEHVQILHPDDLNRLAELEVVASMQPIHATSDMEMADRHWGNRNRYSYAWRTMLDLGALLVYGSDAPVEPIEPMLGIHASVTRKKRDGSYAPDGWRMEEAINMQETLRAFTLAAAETSGQADVLGSITPGKLADFTIYGADLYTIDPDDILNCEVVGTVIGGEFKHRSF